MAQTRFTVLDETRPHRDLAEQNAPMAAHGIGLVNRIWKDLSLVPNAEEIAEPEAWGPSASSGGPSIPDLLSRHAEVPRPSSSTAVAPSADLDCSGRMDRTAATVLCLLFDLTQQAARFGSGMNPWGQLALYDAEDFAPFTTGGPA
ncbi:hypothetical protein AB0I98_35715 [Streptomyces sp. NPDC050211]|uniref:hypothetical protein n=1 Tax=Streptomyces sp. NPDC050211 TaxID=3154932 RepID=UPI0034485840